MRLTAFCPERNGMKNRPAHRSELAAITYSRRKTIMTDELIRRLIAAGLTKQQATSVTAETLVKLFIARGWKDAS